MRKLTILALCFLLFVGASEQRFANFVNNSGGLNTRAGDLAVANNEASDLQNVHFSTTGSILKRKGNAQFGDRLPSGAQDEVTLIGDYQLVDGTQKVVVTAGTKILKTDGTGDGTWDDITQDQSVVFTGGGLNDATSGGTFTGDGDIEYKVVIDATGSPDTFEWFKDSVSQASGVAIDGSAQALDEALTITFAATTGHTVNDQWVFHPATTVTQDLQFDWSQFRNIFLFTNGTDRPISWDQVNSGTKAELMTVPANLTKAKHVAIWSEFTFLANVTVSSTAHPSRFHFSSVGEVATWSALDFVNVGRDKAEGSITLLEPLGDRLVIGKERSAIYNVFFTGDVDLPFIIQQSFSQVGCGAARSAVVVNNVLFFWSTDGVGFYAYDGLNSVEISERIAPTLEDLIASRYADIVGEVLPELNQIWWSATASGSTHDTIIIYDYVNNAWTIYKGIKASYLQLLEKASEFKLYSGDYSGFVLEQNTSNGDVLDGTDNTAIKANYKTKWYDFGNPAMVKSMDHIILYSGIQAAEYNLNVAWAYDFSEQNFANLNVPQGGGGITWGDKNWGDFNWSRTDGGQSNRLDLSGRGRAVRFIFTNNKLDQPFEVIGFSPIFKEESLF